MRHGWSSPISSVASPMKKWPSFRPEQATLICGRRASTENSYIVFAYANRVEIKEKIEEMVFIDGKCYVVQID